MSEPSRELVAEFERALRCEPYPANVVPYIFCRTHGQPWDKGCLAATDAAQLAADKIAALEAERDAALAAIERVRALLGQWEQERLNFPAYGSSAWRIATEAVRTCENELRAALPGDGAS